jgi:DNA-binding response OmpR family regulator
MMAPRGALAAIEASRKLRERVHGARVLFVSSESMARAVEAQAAITAGCQCQTCSSIDEIESAVSTYKPDLLLVDALTAAQHEQSGRPLCLRGLGVPVVLVASEETPPELVENCWRAGIDDCLLRPLRAEDIAARVAMVRDRLKPSAIPAGVALMMVGEETGYRRSLSELLQLNGYRVCDGGTQIFPQAPQLLIVCSPTPRLEYEKLKVGWKLPFALERIPVMLVGEESGSAGGAVESVFLLRRDNPPERVTQQVNARLFPGAKNLRTEARVPFFCPVQFREGGDGVDRPWSSGFSFDVSSGGIFLRTLVPARPHAALEMRIHLTTFRERISATGVVAWANRYESPTAYSYPVGMGVQFLGMISRRLAQLIELCRGE